MLDTVGRIARQHGNRKGCNITGCELQVRQLSALQSATCNDGATSCCTLVVGACTDFLLVPALTCC
jgi:hypothetical protein